MTIKGVQKKIITFVESYGFKLIRRKKHLVFRNKDGLQLVTASSPSDYRALQNIEKHIKNLLKNHDSNHSG